MGKIRQVALGIKIVNGFYSRSGVCTRDGHGIPKCSPCPSVVFLMPPGPSVRFRVFFGVASTYVRHMDR